MRKTGEILRLKWHKGRSHRQIAAALAIGLGTPSEVVGRAKRAGLTISADVERLTDDELDAKLYPPPPTTTDRPLPDPAYLHLQLRRAHVTMRLLHDEYLQQHPDGYGYTRFLRGPYGTRSTIITRSRPTSGAPTSASRPTLMPSATGSCTTPIGSC